LLDNLLKISMMKNYLILLLLFAVSISKAQCVDPGVEEGATGCVTFTYKGVSTTHATVRGSDGNIWLQQNLGSQNVASTKEDVTSYGDLFQWGRWDDGHQSRNSTTATATTPNNPLGVVGNTNYIAGSPAWWTPNALTDKWEASTPADVTDVNGCDPCKALGNGWKLPSETEWETLVDAEGFANPATAFESNLKLPAAGYRSSSNGTASAEGLRGYYWSATPSSTGGKYLYVGTTLANPSAGAPRGQASSIRCMKYPAIQIGYCAVSVEWDVEPITLVNFSNLNNVSSPVVNATPAYEDFTAQTATVSKGQTYTITVKGNTVGQFTHDIRVFMDWNKDGIFDMATEYYALSLEPSTGSDTVEATQEITIPSTATLGSTRMRIIKDQWNVYEEGEFDACLDAYYGQVEDYTLIIEDNLSVGEVSKTNYKLYPNPTSGIVTIQTDWGIENINIYNQLGQLIATQKTTEIDLTNTTMGMYVVQIKFANGQTAIQKIIKK